MVKEETARGADKKSDFTKLGVVPHKIQQFEDGKRSDAKGSNFEWWYFDAILENDAKLVVIFYNKPMVDPTDGLQPYIEVNLTQPDGSKIDENIIFDASEYSSSSEHADVKMGQNYFRGNLDHYEIKVVGKKFQFEISLDNLVPAWRSEAGQVYFGDHDQLTFGWLPSVPKGQVDLQIQLAGKTEQHLTGIGYHDHNWGNVSLLNVLHHWYWGRTNVGDYTVITAHQVATKKYGYHEFLTFMLAKGDKIIAENSDNITYSEKDRFIDPKTKKPIDRQLVYDYDDHQGVHYRITYRYEHTILQSKMIDLISGMKKFLARLARFDGAYLRFTGKVIIQQFSGSEIVDEKSSQAIWEEMYFGHAL